MKGTFIQKDWTKPFERKEKIEIPKMKGTLFQKSVQSLNEGKILLET